MDRRNNRLHGNIDPVQDAIETVYFDEYTPLYEEAGDPILKLFENKETVYDAAGVIERYLHVHEFIAYLQTLIAEPARNELDWMTNESTFGYDVARQRPGRLFAGFEPMMLMPLGYDDELRVDWNKPLA